jgi:membrane-bound serine protease (ClpP class)
MKWLTILLLVSGAILLFYELVVVESSDFFVAGGIGALLIVIGLGTLTLKYFVLRTELGSDEGYNSAAKEDYSEYLGQTGVALTVLRPAGTAMIENKRLDVVSVGDFIEVDVPIQVVNVEGSKIMVEKDR